MTSRNSLEPQTQNAMQPHSRWDGSTLLWILTLLFALRVLAQALQRWLPQAFLPSFERFQGSNLSYPMLLTAQVLILIAMLGYSWKAQRNERRLINTLSCFGAIYMIGSVARIAIGLTISSAPPWFSAWISAVFHLVLAGYLLTLAWTYHCASVGREIDNVA
jgi:hypothetical protein